MVVRLAIIPKCDVDCVLRPSQKYNNNRKGMTELEHQASKKKNNKVVFYDTKSMNTKHADRSPFFSTFGFLQNTQ